MDSTQHEWRMDAIENARLDATRAHILYSQSHLTFLFPLIAALFLCALLWDVAGRPITLAWLALVTGLTLIRFRMLGLYRRERPADGVHDRWLNNFALSALLSGLLWGAAPMIVVPHEPHRVVEYTLYRGLVMLVVCGLVAGATVAYAASLRTLFCYIVPALLPPGLYLVFLGDRYNGVLGGFVLLYLAYISTVAVRMHLQLRRYLEMEYQLNRLRADVDGTRNQTIQNIAAVPEVRAQRAGE